MTLKEIQFDTFETQSQSQNDYARKLIPSERIMLLNELNKQAFWRELRQPIKKTNEIVIFTQTEQETEKEFFDRIMRERK